MILIEKDSSSREGPVKKTLRQYPNFWEKVDKLEAIRVTQIRYDEEAVWGRAVSHCGRYHLWVEGRPFYQGKPRGAENIAQTLLNGYLEHESLSKLVLNSDGGATLFLYDSRKETLEVVTDLLGLYPVFKIEKKHSVLSTHSDWLAEVVEEDLSLDEVSLVEQMFHSSVSPPYTFYKEMREMREASRYLFDLKKGIELVEENVFWRPKIGSDYTYKKSQESLASALKQAVELRTGNKQPKIVLLSGGADSRLILGANLSSSSTEAITLVDKKNQESDVASTIANIGCVSHEVIIRDPDHYVKTSDEVMSICGGFGSPMDNHILHLIKSNRFKKAHSLLTGCHGDYFFKSVFLPKRRPVLLGKSLPLPKLKGDYMKMPKRFLNNDSELSKLIEKRWDERLQRYKTSENESDPNLLEISRVLPLSREIDSAFRTTMARTLPWDPLFYSRDLIDIMWRIPAQMKMEHAYYEKAVMSVIGKEYLKIKNCNYGSPMGAGKYKKTICYLKLLTEKAFKKKRGISNSSWPNYKALLKQQDQLKKELEGFKNDPYLADLFKEATLHPLEYYKNINIDIIYNIIGVKKWLKGKK